MAAAGLAAAAGYALSTFGGHTRSASCAVSAVRVSEYGSNAAAGTMIIVLRVADATNRSCALSGTPALIGLAVGGRRKAVMGIPGVLPPVQLGAATPVVINATAPAGVVLASAEVPVNADARCLRLVTMRFALRGSSRSVDVPLRSPLPICGRPAFTVSAFYPLAALSPLVRALDPSQP